LPILVTPEGIDIEVKPEHPLKAELPILVTPEGIEIEVSPVKLANIFSFILVAELGII
jgi:hypothetical protein